MRTAKENTIKLNRYRTIDDALQDIKSFQDYHNNQRRLKMLGGTTPLEKVFEYYQEKPELFLKEPNQGFWIASSNIKSFQSCYDKFVY